MKNRKKVIAVAAVLAVISLYILSFENRASPEPLAAQEKMGAMPGMPAEKPSAEKAPPQEAAAEAPTFDISPEKQQLIGVKVATAQVLPLTKTIRTVGLVEYDQRRLKTINTKVEGWVEKLYVNFAGSIRKEGGALSPTYTARSSGRPSRSSST